jgi:hypothetical protein
MIQMRVSIERQGGVMGGRWSAHVTDDAVSVSSNGREAAARALTSADRARLDQMVEAVLAAPQPKSGPRRQVPDGMLTELEIHHGRRRRRLRLYSGAQAPSEVVQLIRTVRQVANGSG